MANKLLHILLLISIFAQALCSCEKLELPKEEKGENNTPQVVSPIDIPSKDENGESTGGSNDSSGEKGDSTEENSDSIEENSDSIEGNEPSEPSWKDLAETIGTDPDYPVSVADIKGTVEQIFAETGIATLPLTYVRGYIVGSIKKGGKSINSAVFGSSDVASNIVIADSPNETDCKKCVAVELASNSAARTKLNLQDNPENLHKQILVLGTIQKYMGVLGVKSTKLVKLYEE